MSSLFETIQRFFEEDDWPFSILADQPVLQMPFEGDNGRWLCYAYVRESAPQFIFHSVCPVTVAPASRPAVAEYITRANYGLSIGNFEMDYADGEVRFKTCAIVEGAADQNVLRETVYANVLLVDHYLPGMMAVLYGEVAPAEAIAQVEAESMGEPA